MSTDFEERMALAESIISTVEYWGGEIVMDGAKLVVRNIHRVPERDLKAVRDERVAIADYLSISAQPVSERAAKEYRWLREFAEEFGRTAWRRIGGFTDQEATDFYGLVSTEYNESASKVEPGLAALMGIADALTEHRQELERRAGRLAARDGVASQEWMRTLQAGAESNAKRGSWRNPNKPATEGIIDDDDFPF